MIILYPSKCRREKCVSCVSLPFKLLGLFFVVLVDFSYGKSSNRLIDIDRTSVLIQWDTFNAKSNGLCNQWARSSENKQLLAHAANWSQNNGQANRLFCDHDHDDNRKTTSQLKAFDNNTLESVATGGHTQTIVKPLGLFEREEANQKTMLFFNTEIAIKLCCSLLIIVFDARKAK